MDWYGTLADAVDILPEKEVTHGGVAHHHHLADFARIARELFDGMRQISCQRASQQLAGMQRVVLNACHHFGTAKTLRVFERSVGCQFAAREIVQTNHHGGCPQVHGDAVASGIYAAGGKTTSATETSGATKTTGSTFDLHLAAPHGVAPDLSVSGHNLGAARQPEVAVQMALWRCGCREAVHPFRHLYHAFLALPLLVTGCGDTDSEALGAIEERFAGRGLSAGSVDGECYGHCDSSSAFTASATSWAEPSRCSSSLQRHCAR